MCRIAVTRGKNSPLVLLIGALQYVLHCVDHDLFTLGHPTRFPSPFSAEQALDEGPIIVFSSPGSPHDEKEETNPKTLLAPLNSLPRDHTEVIEFRYFRIGIQLLFGFIDDSVRCGLAVGPCTSLACPGLVCTDIDPHCPCGTPAASLKDTDNRIFWNGSIKDRV